MSFLLEDALVFRRPRCLLCGKLPQWLSYYKLLIESASWVATTDNRAQFTKSVARRWECWMQIDLSVTFKTGMSKLVG
jgi:hypothetical protein